MRNLILTLLVAVLVTPAFCSAQPEAGQKAKVLETLDKTKPKQFYHAMAIRMDDIQQACELSDSQLKRLTVASKGAVRNCLKRQRKQLEESYGMMQNMLGVEVDQDDEQGDEQDDKQDDISQDEITQDEFQGEITEGELPGDLQGKILQGGPTVQVGGDAPIAVIELNGRGASFNASGVSDMKNKDSWWKYAVDSEGTVSFTSGYEAFNEEVWKKEVARVLNDAQKVAYKKHVAQRQDFRRVTEMRESVTELEQYVMELDQTLFLSVEQRKALLERGLAENLKRAEIPEKVLQEILTESQFAVWKSTP